MRCRPRAGPGSRSARSCVTILRPAEPQWSGIWRPPERGRRPWRTAPGRPLGRHTRHEADPQVAVVGDPHVLAAPHRPRRPDLAAFVSGDRDHERRLAHAGSVGTRPRRTGAPSSIVRYIAKEVVAREAERPVGGLRHPCRHCALPRTVGRVYTGVRAGAPSPTLSLGSSSPTLPSEPDANGKAMTAR